MLSPDQLEGSYGEWLLSEETTFVKFVYLPSENGSTLKGKNLLPRGANSFLLEYTLFLKGLVCPRANVVIRVVS